MAKVTILGQVRQSGGKRVQVRGVFTQKKKLWVALEKIAGSLIGKFFFDDVTSKEYDPTYSVLCNRLRITGRATILDEHKEKEFLVVETTTNEIRDWDTTEDGLPKCNPAKGADDEEKSE
jgi:hypothetical protein